jgi:hypothetical protein
MNPYPFVGLNHFTVPVAICVSNCRPRTIRVAREHDKDRDRSLAAASTNNPILSGSSLQFEIGGLTPRAFRCCRAPISRLNDRPCGASIPNLSYGWMSGVSFLDAFMSVKTGTFREFQLYIVWLQTWHLA